MADAAKMADPPTQDDSELAKFVKFAFPEIWEKYNSFRLGSNTAVASRAAFDTDSPLSPDVAPASPLPTTGNSPASPAANGHAAYLSDSGSDMEVEDAPPDDGFTVVVRKKGKKRAARNEDEPNSDSSDSSPHSGSPIGTPAKKAASQTRQPIAKRKTKTKKAIQPQKPASQTDAAATSGARAPKPPPPIILQDKGRWNDLSLWMTKQKILCPKAQTTAQGIRVFLNTTDDFRTVTRHLRNGNISFHTYSLEEDRRLRVVIRGLPKEQLLEHIKNDLVAQNIPVQEVHRMYHPRKKSPYDLTLAILDLSPEGKQIFNVTSICGLTNLSVEAPRNKGIINQCHRCQLYGHSARNCYARPRCVKCLGDHGTPDCERTRDATEPPSCVLCGEQGHPANYRGCIRAPRKRQLGGSNRNGRSKGPGAPRSQPSAPKPAPAKPASAKLAPAKPAPANPAPATPAPAKPAPAKPAPATKTPTTAEPTQKNAWKKPLAYTQQSAVASRPAASIPAPQGASNFAADFSLVCGFINSINVADLTILACKIREAKSPQERLMATIEHMPTIDAIWSFQCA